jgi:hypothetical protein
MREEKHICRCPLQEFAKSFSKNALGFIYRDSFGCNGISINSSYIRCPVHEVLKGSPRGSSSIQCQPARVKN